MSNEIQQAMIPGSQSVEAFLAPITSFGASSRPTIIGGFVWDCFIKSCIAYGNTH